jgi:anaerobic sulfite reductase subunit C
MKWTAEADEAVRRVPFFVRKRVKSRVEAHVDQAGRRQVTLADVHAVKEQYMKNMEKEVRGYRVEVCFGPGGCPNRAAPDEDLAGRIEALFAEEDLLGFLKKTVGRPLKFHHEFCVALADCPNACSRPQIRDIGIIGVSVVAITNAGCSMCGECVETCKEGALSLDEARQMPELDRSRCLDCGECARACPTQTIQTVRQGYKIFLGGKLGRHPRLAQSLPGCYDAGEVLDIVRQCVAFYKQHSTGGKRFAQLYAESPEAVKAALADRIHLDPDTL